MKKSTLIIRSLGIIILLTGIAQLFTFVSKKNDLSSEKNDVSIVSDNKKQGDAVLESSLEQTVSNVSNQTTKNTSLDHNQETDYIIGKWAVTYTSEEFKGLIIYDIKKEDKLFNAYLHEYEDDKGNAQKADEVKTLSIKEFDGYKGKGSYKIEYEGKKYDVACQIDMLDENTFKLSYDYYGYSDVETWKRH